MPRNPISSRDYWNVFFETLAYERPWAPLAGNVLRIISPIRNSGGRFCDLIDAVRGGKDERRKNYENPSMLFPPWPHLRAARALFYVRWSAH